MTFSFATDTFLATEGLLLAAACSIFPPPEKRGTASQENLKILAAHTGEGSVAVGHRTERFSFVLFVVGDDFVRHRCGFQPL